MPASLSAPAESGTVAALSVCPFSSPPVPPAHGVTTRTSPLTFGVPAVDTRLPAGGLQTHGLHEMRPQTARDAGTALAVALALAGRSAPRPVLVVLSGRSGSDHGLPYGPGLAGLGLDPERVLIVTAGRRPEALWAIEEGLRAGSLGAVVGVVDAVGMLPARRLVLAAGQGRTPCLLLTGPGSGGIAVAHTRWRIASLASAAHAWDPAAPGPWRCRLGLERCRQGPGDLTWTLEWCGDAETKFRAVGTARGPATVSPYRLDGPRARHLARAPAA